MFLPMWKEEESSEWISKTHYLLLGFSGNDLLIENSSGRLTRFHVKEPREPVLFPVFILDSRGILLVCYKQVFCLTKKEWKSLKYMQNQHANI